jgi:hypothetical protein
MTFGGQGQIPERKSLVPEAFLLASCSVVLLDLGIYRL